MINFNSEEEWDEYKILFAKFIYYHRVSINTIKSLHQCLEITELYLQAGHRLRLTKEDLLELPYEKQIIKWRKAQYRDMKKIKIN